MQINNDTYYKAAANKDKTMQTSKQKTNKHRTIISGFAVYNDQSNANRNWFSMFLSLTYFWAQVMKEQ